jgi:hypothetical protein
VISPSQRPVPTQDTNAQKHGSNYLALSRIRTHDLSVQAIKVYASRQRGHWDRRKTGSMRQSVITLYVLLKEVDSNRIYQFVSHLIAVYLLIQNKNSEEKPEILTAVRCCGVLWVVTPCVLVDGYQLWKRFASPCRKVRNEELRILYSSSNIIRPRKSRRMRLAGHVARMGQKRKVYRVLVGKSQGKRPLGRTTRRWEDRIKTDLTETGWNNTE